MLYLTRFAAVLRMVASQQKERKWIEIDIAEKYVDLVAGRLLKTNL